MGWLRRVFKCILAASSCYKTQVQTLLDFKFFSTCQSICCVVHIGPHFPFVFCVEVVKILHTKILSYALFIPLWISFWPLTNYFCVLMLGVHYPSLASLCSQKVVESERGFLMSTVGSGSYLGWVKPCTIYGEWWGKKWWVFLPIKSLFSSEKRMGSFKI